MLAYVWDTVPIFRVFHFYYMLYEFTIYECISYTNNTSADWSDSTVMQVHPLCDADERKQNTSNWVDPLWIDVE